VRTAAKKRRQDGVHMRIICVCVEREKNMRIDLDTGREEQKVEGSGVVAE